jgi:3-hydroxyisobutyrate dehydrogenase/glyoxylate/succinic semialdehyde reductase
MKIGFIGLGIMGSRMAANLVKNDHDLVVWNRTRSKADALVEQGATWADSPAALAPQVDVLFTMLAHPPAVREAAEGEDGFLNHLQSGSLWVDSSTVNPSFSKEMAAKAQDQQIRFLDAPVAGTKGPAEKGEVLYLVGGDAKDLQEVQDLLDIMGRKTIHVGEHGMGSAMKMVFNLLLGEGTVAFVEAMLLGQSLGISRDTLFDTLLGGRLVPGFLTGKRAMIEADDYEANFPLQWMQKDLQLASVSAYEGGLALPGVNVAKEIFALAMRYGFAGEDYGALYKFLAQEVDTSDNPLD